ncbi:acetate--CoA ligase [Thermodesulfovibrio sp.]|jgi:acetyl-CoA synthetase|uniref:acetate--CoA ligase n=1 Tax=Thermodesulfovibrio TaxID=28261 RepID=UPI00261E41E2|nr:acetate--CoA ligase [Thermodesulfovibrio sp.]
MSQGIDVLLKEQRVFPPPKEIAERAYIKSMQEYETMYKRSVEDPEGFWAEIAEQNITWYKKWDKVLDYDFNKPYIKWFIGGKLNASYNCLDRHLSNLGNKAALIWEADDGEVKTYTYWQLYREVNRFANVLKKLGIKKGDRVSIYLPMIPELPITLLACARIGAIHSVVFAGFSAQSLRDRINDCGAKLLITANQGVRGGRIVPLKANADQALEGAPSVEKVIVVQRTPNFVDMDPQRDYWWHDLMNDPEIKNFCQPEEMDAEDPLFILYTSGSTGKPKGVLHTTGGYMVYTNITFRLVFDYKPEEIFFCTADIGWVTGHSYIVYGPLSAGATSLMFEGVPTYPNPGRFWDIVEKHRVNIFYTAPTAIRALMREGEKWPNQYDLSSLRILGTVGEPINPEAWVWYFKYVGKERCPIVDTWWQTETGGFMITPLPGAMTLKPGSATRPFFGVVPKVLKEDGSPAGVNEGGYLVIEKPWPGMLRGTWGDSENKRIKEVYFSRFPGRYFTGDGARVDEDGDYWLMGRIDDVINVSGHRIGTAEVESALVAHPSVAEAAVVGFPHDIKGEGIYVYVVLKEGFEPSKDLEKLLISHIRQMIGPIATPDKIQFAGGLPKTRSGKIMRRILRKIASGALEELGDTSTLADPSVVEELISGRK